MFKFLTTFKEDIILLKRLIDDLFCIWQGSKDDFIAFQNICNNFGVLKWEFSKLTKTTNFLDLHIELKDGVITTKTYEKPHNLYQYIVFTSSQSSYCKKSLIWSLCYRFYHLNDKDQDYIFQVKKLYNRLLKRGYPQENTKQIILEATKHLESTPKGTFNVKDDSTNSLDSTFIYKSTFSNSLDKNHIKNLMKKHLQFKNVPESNFNYNRSIICFKKDKNLLELISPSKLIVPKKFLKEFKENS